MATTNTVTAGSEIRLNDGRSIPQLGFGVWQIENDKVTECVATAINAGYGLIDTAQGYDNETGVGEALRGADVDRQALFITTKLRTKHCGYDGAIAGVRESLQALQLDYLDMILIHWPTPALGDYVETWRGLVQARADGLVHSIGVSNFLKEHLDRLSGESDVLPAVNQIETHPYFQQNAMRSYLQTRGIRHESYSPLGSGAVLKDKTLEGIATKYGKSIAQVIIRWHLQRDSIVIPKSETPSRIEDNAQVFDFALADEDVAAIDALDKTPEGRTGSDPATYNDEY